MNRYQQCTFFPEKKKRKFKRENNEKYTRRERENEIKWKRIGLENKKFLLVRQKKKIIIMI